MKYFNYFLILFLLLPNFNFESRSIEYDALTGATYPGGGGHDDELIEAIEYHYPYKWLIDIIDRTENLNAKNRDGFSPILMVIDKNSLKRDQLILYMLRKGAFAHTFDNFGISALHLTIFKNFPSTFAILLKNGADPDFKNINGDTPLHYAVHQSKHYDDKTKEDKKESLLEMMEVLLEEMRDPFTKNSQKKTVLDLAKEQSKKSTFSKVVYENLKFFYDDINGGSK